MARLNPGRLAAARALLAVDKGGHVEDLLARYAPESGPDRGLAWHLALGVLRRRGTLDRALSEAGRPLDAVDDVPRVCLRLGLFEARLARTRTHAAVDQAVELCKRLRAGRASGFVNAVLRKALTFDLPDDPLSDLPEWLARRWATWPEWVARQREPGVLAVAGDPPPGAVPAGPAASWWLPTAAGAVEQIEGYAEGSWWVMDPAAAAVADLCQGDHVLDACAAPGGKSFRLAARGARVTCVDASQARLERLAQNASRLRMDLSLLQHDWLAGPHPELGRFDSVLVDAPCTGLGTVRRHPEIKWRRLPSDPAAMALRQLAILQAAAEHVAPGGELVYAVCSPMPEEGRGVVALLEGWSVQQQWDSCPPTGDEDAFQAFVLRRA